MYGNPVLFLPLYTAVLLACSHLTYRFVEIPCSRLCKSWLARARAA